jgi:hypothetical protein
MSTFSDWNWNGPGINPGDLTIFYQRLRELWLRVDRLATQWGDPSMGSTGGVVQDLTSEITRQVNAAETRIQQPIPGQISTAVQPAVTSANQAQTAASNAATQATTAAADARAARLAAEAAQAALGNTSNAVNAELAAIRQEFNAVHNAIDSILDSSTDIATSGNIRAEGAYLQKIFSHVPANAPQQILEFVQDLVIAFRRWAFVAEAILVNRIDSFDQIRFKQYAGPTFNGDHQSPLAGNDPDTDVAVLHPDVRRNLRITECGRQRGCYMLGVVTVNRRDFLTSDVAAGTIYFTSRDSLNISAVIDVVLNMESQGSIPTWHGALKVTYVNSTLTGQPRIEFGICHTPSTTYTNAAGIVITNAPIFYIYARPIGVGTVTPGHVWMVGRGIERWISGHGFVEVMMDGTPHGIITAITSNPGIGQGQCHGNLITGIVTDEISVRDEIVIDTFGFMEVGRTLDVDDSLPNNQYPFQVHRPARFFNDVNIDGTLTVENLIAPKDTETELGDLQVDNLHVLEDLRVDGNTDLRGNLDTRGATDLHGTLRARGNTTLDQGATVGGALGVQGAATVQGDLTARNGIITDKVTSSNPSVWLESTPDQINIGSLEKHLDLRTKDTAERIELRDGSSNIEKIAYLSDQIAGMMFQRGVTVFTSFEPPTTLTGEAFNSVMLQHGIPYVFQVGDVALVQGTITSQPKYFTVVDVPIDTGRARWEETSIVPLPRLVGDPQHYEIFQWFGLAHHGEFWANSYIIWNPNNPVGSGDWTIADLHMEYYRTFYDQDNIDEVNHVLSMIQPDFFEDEPLLDVAKAIWPLPLPPRMPSQIPNPAFINNRPWMGLSMLDGGDWDADHFGHDVVIEGGDFDLLLGQIESSTLEEPPVHETYKNSVQRIMRGESSNMPAASSNTAYTLKFCTDTHEMYIDLGNPLATVPGRTVVDGNLLLG